MFIHDSHNSKYYYTVNKVMKKILCWLLSKEYNSIHYLLKISNW